MTQQLRPEKSFTLVRFLRQAITLAVIMFSALGCYILVLKWRGPAAQHVTYLPMDDWFPYRPAWVWVYMIPYIVGPVAVGFMQPATFRWYIQRGLLVIAITLAIFIVVPTQTAPR